MHEKLGLLLHYWTAKEAITKAIGEGIGYPLATLDVASIRTTLQIPVEGKVCSYREFIAQNEKGKALIVLTVLDDEAHDLKDVELEMLPVDRIVEDVLRLAKPEY